MIHKIKQWLSGKKNQFTLFTKVENGVMNVCVHFHKCGMVINIGQQYSASWHRGLSIMFYHPNKDNIHIEYTLAAKNGEVLNQGVIQADDIRFEQGVFRIWKHDTKSKDSQGVA
jgi:hypothetical protein